MSEEINPEGKPGVEPGTPEPAKPEPKMLTQDEVNRIVEKEKARVKAQYEKAEAERIAAAEEQQRLEALKGEEKLKEKHRLEKERLEKELSETKRGLAIANAQAKLSSLGLDPEFAENLIGADEEVTEANITRFNQMIEALVTKKVQGNLQHGAPPDPEAGGRPSPEADELNKLRAIAGLK